ncbi:MAG: 4-oxalocrotonate tautomerase family protein [bacterium]|nr:4-oxalocrotonate tautomerase family protein [bacterium]
MPIVTINMLEGRGKEKKKALVENVTKAIVDTLKAPPESVRIIIREMAHEDYGVGGMPVNEYRLKMAEHDDK